MKDIHLDTNFVKNYPIDSTKEPDRFVRLSGKNNYRSGRIVSLEQLAMLKSKYGIKNVVNLALDSMRDQSDERFDCGGTAIPCEPLWAAYLNLNYFPAYIGSKPPSEKNWKIIKELLTDGNTLIHCTWGVDRTGAVAGAWNKTIQDIDNDTVLKDYTYKFGGQWLGKEDHNRHLRAWVKSQNFDPVQRSLVEKSLSSSWKKLALIGSSILLSALVFQNT